MKTVVVALACLAVAQAGLLRVPKVYNALVTTKEKLVPSRAYSVSAPVFQPVGLTPAIPIIPIPAVPEPEDGSEDSTPPNLGPAEPAAPEKGSEDEPERKMDAEPKTNIHPIVPPIALPVAYYNSLTYYHSVWPHAYSAISPGYVFTAPFAYPGIVSDFYAPLLPGRKPVKEESASGKSAEGSLPEGAKVDAENDSVSVETS